MHAIVKNKYSSNGEKELAHKKMVVVFCDGVYRGKAITNPSNKYEN